MSNILITGGAGYIGTNVVNALKDSKHNITIIDDYSNSKATYLNILLHRYPNIKMYQADYADSATLTEIFKKNNIDIVIHLAGKKYVGESEVKKELYTLDNVTKTKTLLDYMSRYKVGKIIFPSSITVYGENNIVSEDSTTNPLCHYAETKLQGEKLIKEWAKSTGNRYTILRLSNPIGASMDGYFGDDSNTSAYKNLLSYILESIDAGKPLVFNGNNHPTPDGTTIRDYVYVEDVAKCIVNSIDLDTNETINVGAGVGTSVLQILKQVMASTDTTLPYSFGPRIAKDISSITTDNTKARRLLKVDFSTPLSTKIDTQIKFNNIREK